MQTMLQVLGVVLLLFHGVTAQSCTTGSVRFYTSPYTGIVEVCLNGTWGTVCADSPNTLWSEKNAQVFCKRLGYSGALNSVDQSTWPSSYAVNPTTPINYKSVRCNGTETSLSQCSHSENITGCTHAYDAAVVCRQSVSDGDIRLVGSTANGQGAVEIYDDITLQWLRVCPTGWTSSYAAVVCQQLGYQTGAAFIYSLNSGITQKSPVYCTSTSSQCYTYGTCTDTSNRYAGVSCSSSSSLRGAVRLSGGSRPSVGRVEVLYNGVWGTVCSYARWTLAEAQVVCSQLGYKNISTISVSPSTSLSPLSSLYPVWLNGVNCGSMNTNITQCGYTKPIGYGQYCSSHSFDAKVDCQVSSSDSSSGVPLGALGALGVVAAVPVAGVRYASPICKFLGQCLRCLECCSFVWLQSVWLNLRLLLCCCFLSSLVRSASRDHIIQQHDDVVVQVVTTSPASVGTSHPAVDKRDSELVQAPPPAYNEASNYASPSPSAPPPPYAAPPPQYNTFADK